MRVNLYTISRSRKGRNGPPPDVGSQVAEAVRLNGRRRTDGWTRVGGTPPMLSKRCGDYTGAAPLVGIDELRKALGDFERRRKLSGNRLTMDQEVMRKALEAGMRAKLAEEDARKAMAETERAAGEAKAAAEQARRAADDTEKAAQDADDARNRAESAAGESSEAAELAKRSMDESSEASELARRSVAEAEEARRIARGAAGLAEGAARKADGTEAEAGRLAKAAEAMRSDIEALKREMEGQDGEAAAKLERIADSLDELVGMFRYGDAFVRKVGDFARPRRPDAP